LGQEKQNSNLCAMIDRCTCKRLRSQLEYFNDVHSTSEVKEHGTRA
jgi:hypothetical protein